MTALIEAAYMGNKLILASLLKHDANIEAVDKVIHSDDMHTNEFMCIYDNLHIYHVSVNKL